jgi:CHAD domain-containing protein
MHSKPKTPPISLRQVEDSLERHWTRYRKVFKRCRRKFSKRAIHEARVETRRLLAVIELLRDFLSAAKLREIESALKGRLDIFDAVRDTQVQLALIEETGPVFGAARRFRDHLIKREKRVARKALRNAGTASLRPLGRLVAGARDDVHSNSRRCTPEQAGARLLHSADDAFQRAVELRERIEARDPQSIHTTRIAFKKFRYMVEALSEYLGATNEQSFAAMHDYQSMMGDIQDADVLLKAWEKFLRKKGIDSTAARQFSQQLLHRRQSLIQAYLERADLLREFWPLSQHEQSSNNNHELIPLSPRFGS